MIISCCQDQLEDEARRGGEDRGAASCHGVAHRQGDVAARERRVPEPRGLRAHERHPGTFQGERRPLRCPEPTERRVSHVLTTRGSRVRCNHHDAEM